MNIVYIRKYIFILNYLNHIVFELQSAEKVRITLRSVIIINNDFRDNHYLCNILLKFTETNETLASKLDKPEKC